MDNSLDEFNEFDLNPGSELDDTDDETYSPGNVSSTSSDETGMSFSITYKTLYTNNDDVVDVFYL
jgi:hypothetical protein